MRLQDGHRRVKVGGTRARDRSWVHPYGGRSCGPFIPCQPESSTDGKGTCHGEYHHCA
jgi:hypothetical protein